MELSMNITAYRYWSSNWLNVTFFNKNFFYFFAENSEFAFWQNCSTLYCF